jgi:methanogenic corrinoid protein MtbC1
MLQELRAAWVRLGPLRFLEDVAGRFLTDLGGAWQRHEVEVRHEHFAAACTSDFLRTVREPYDQRARGPRVVAAMLPEERHEGGLLLVSLLLALRGRRVLYLGIATPIEEIAAAVRSTSAEGVVVSVSAAMAPASSAAALAALRRALPARLALWTGGAGAPAPERGIERFDSLGALDARLG